MKNKSKFQQKSFWLYPEDNPTEYIVLIEHDENHIPLGTIIVKVPKRYLLALRCYTILN
jgi:hypothetical protein